MLWRTAVIKNPLRRTTVVKNPLWRTAVVKNPLCQTTIVKNLLWQTAVIKNPLRRTTIVKKWPFLDRSQEPNFWTSGKGSVQDLAKT